MKKICLVTNSSCIIITCACFIPGVTSTEEPASKMNPFYQIKYRYLPTADFVLTMYCANAGVAKVIITNPQQRNRRFK